LKKIIILNPSIKDGGLSPNRGDQIISRSTEREVKILFPNAIVKSISTHNYLSFSEILEIRKADYTFVGGSNLLWFRFFPAASWKIGLLQLLFVRRLVLLGVGWGSYELKAGIWGRFVCKILLSKTMLHSTRDAYTEQKLKDLGIHNVINTGCHTTWDYDLSSNIKDAFSENRDIMLFTLTDYRKSKKLDQIAIDLARNTCKDIYFWVQGSKDLEYLNSFKHNFKILDIELIELELFIKNNVSRLVYFGTRLHCGILCMEYKVPSLIIKVDNRAEEMSKSLNLPLIDRDTISEVKTIKPLFKTGPELILTEKILEWRKSIK
jgi:polysaccharide pyruvyl transferase WcaK-like protein